MPRMERHSHLHGDLTDRQVFTQTSLREPALSAASQAGRVNNLNDGLTAASALVVAVRIYETLQRRGHQRPL